MESDQSSSGYSAERISVKGKRPFSSQSSGQPNKKQRVESWPDIYGAQIEKVIKSKDETIEKRCANMEENISKLIQAQERSLIILDLIVRKIDQRDTDIETIVKNHKWLAIKLQELFNHLGQ